MKNNNLKIISIKSDSKINSVTACHFDFLYLWRQLFENTMSLFHRLLCYFKVRAKKLLLWIYWGTWTLKHSYQCAERAHLDNENRCLLNTFLLINIITSILQWSKWVEYLKFEKDCSHRFSDLYILINHIAV